MSSSLFKNRYAFNVFYLKKQRLQLQITNENTFLNEWVMQLRTKYLHLASETVSVLVQLSI